jgi:hypothetical protein
MQILKKITSMVLKIIIIALALSGLMAKRCTPLAEIVLLGNHGAIELGFLIKLIFMRGLCLYHSYKGVHLNI